MRKRKEKRSKVKEQTPQITVITEKEALQQLGISSFRKMKREKIPKFCSVLPYMEPEVACAALDKFPHFVNLMSDIVAYYRDITINVLESEAEQTVLFYDSCNKILNSLSQLLQQKRVKRRERREIEEQMCRIAQMQRNDLRESREWRKEIIELFGVIAGVITGLVAMVLGVHLGRK